MTPKEKAEKVFNKMYQVDDVMGNYPMCFDTAKQCALIAVDEMINTCSKFKILSDMGYTHFKIEKNYLEEVKQEIEKL